MSTVATRITAELTEQREFLANYDKPTGYDYEAFHAELTRRNGRPLDRSHTEYWGKQVVAYLLSTRDAAGQKTEHARVKRLHAVVRKGRK